MYNLIKYFNFIHVLKIVYFDFYIVGLNIKITIG